VFQRWASPKEFRSHRFPELSLIKNEHTVGYFQILFLSHQSPKATSDQTALKLDCFCKKKMVKKRNIRNSQIKEMKVRSKERMKKQK